MQIFQFRTDGRALDPLFTHVQPEGVGKILEVQFVDSQTIVVLGVSFAVVLQCMQGSLSVAERRPVVQVNPGGCQWGSK